MTVTTQGWNTRTILSTLYVDRSLKVRIQQLNYMWLSIIGKYLLVALLSLLVQQLIASNLVEPQWNLNAPLPPPHTHRHTHSMVNRIPTMFLKILLVISYHLLVIVYGDWMHWMSYKMTLFLLFTKLSGCRSPSELKTDHCRMWQYELSTKAAREWRATSRGVGNLLQWGCVRLFHPTDATLCVSGK